MSEGLTKDLIQNALDQDYNKANDVFGELMTIKIADVLDQEKINLAGQIYNGEESNDNPDEDQMELDLNDEEEEEVSQEEDSNDEEDEEENVSDTSQDVEEPMGDEDNDDSEK